MKNTVFSSLEFIFGFLPITLLLYYAVPKKFLFLRNAVLLIVSLFFYGWGEPKLVLLMMGTILFDWLCGILISSSAQKSAGRAKHLMIFSVIVNLGILGFFKYANFICENLAAIPFLSWIESPDIKLPIGISFYTFQALSYVIDVYRRDTELQKNPVNFGAYVTLFPQLIAGPIVRYRDIDDALSERGHSLSRFSDGIMRFICGLLKKVLIANVLGELWSSFRDMPISERTVFGCIIGLVFYTLQIYFDFSGYSDMAIGLGRMFGFEFCENFNYPYIATSITDFWRRWHISLSTWFRDYLYIPLGGSRNGRFNTYRNLFVVWLCTGIWHGASWNFILWGLFYFVLLVIEKSFLLEKLEKIPNAVRRIYTMFFVIIGWWLFVSEDLSYGIGYFSSVLGLSGEKFISYVNIYDILRNLPLLTIAIVGATPLPKKLYDKLCERSEIFRTVFAVGGFALTVIAVAYLVNSSYNPFLYTTF